MEKWGSAALRKLGSDLSFDVRNPLVADWLDGYRSVTLVDINATTADRLRDRIAEGVKRGEGVDEIARGMGEFFDEVRAGRATVIARTETGSAMNAANLSAYQLSGLVDEKEWLATQDANTRETHSEMDGQVRPITGYFTSPSGNSASAPGQFGVAEEDINCRCAVLPIVADKASPSGEERATEWRQFVAEVEAESGALLTAFRKGFTEQEAIALATLRRVA
jgi:SPP1 gp7 family putative phage head morphogenesis protein